MNPAPPKLLFDKVWDAHCITSFGGGYDLIYIDRHMLHELLSNIAFDTLRQLELPVRRPDLCFATHDHVISTAADRHDDSWPESASYIHALRDNSIANGIRLFDFRGPQQGIVHVVAPELGIALPGTTLVCGDSHTCTVGGIGTLSWGIGTSEVAHVLATQTLVQKRPQVLRIRCDGRLGDGVSAKDLILALIGKLGPNTAAGYAIEYCGSAISALPIEQRLTMCNLSIEMGARMGQIAPDDHTFDYLAGRQYAPSGVAWDNALVAWRELASDDGAKAAREVCFDAGQVGPQITWGTSPAHVIAIDGLIPDPSAAVSAEARRGMEKALDYMALTPGTRIADVAIDAVFIGSCTNGRLSDLRSAASTIEGRHVANGVRALVVPGSTSVKRQAEAEGLDKVFIAAGFEWRESGCSMCVALNDDRLEPGQRCVSTSNRNFEGRQGKGSRTHLASLAVAAASAVMGRIADHRVLCG